jgi:asparagine synthase (glutamine-hydrolysing)
MRDALQHRGPDDAGAWWSADARAALAHRRLSIIDLSTDARQPMGDSSGQLQIVFNGEIYNYRELKQTLESLGHHFRTASDTEVILEAYRAWGDRCLDHLNGMFAFALYDSTAGRVLLARDRAGEKPLYYRRYGRALAFASELKGLLADPECPRRLDAGALDHYLAFGYVPGGGCLLQGIAKLPQGHALTFDVRTNDFRTWPYWSLPRPEPSTHTDEELVEELERLLTDSIRLRLIADVPVGIMLSGGLDSSLVTALAARVSPGRVKTFNISFPGYGTFDESPHARLVARHFDTEHVELAAEPAAIEVLPELVRQFDEPIADSSMIPTYLVSRLIRQQATVALGGDGGDELFGGYPHHSWAQQYARVGSWIPPQARLAAGRAVKRLLPVGTKGRNYLLSLTARQPYNLVQFNVLFDDSARRELLGWSATESASPEAYKAVLCAGELTPLQQITALDFRTYLVDDILVKTDRASMLCSLEVRAPFLDPRLIDLAFRRVPDRLRATGTERKVLCRRLAERLLPPGLDLKRKQGFSLPLQKWFKGDWGAFTEDVLTSAGADLFDRRIVRQLLKGQRAGFSNTHRLFALMMIELWRREYKIQPPVGAEQHDLAMLQI